MLTYKKQRKTFIQIISPWTGSILLLPIAVYYIVNAGKFTFIDFVNLLIHEGGHGVFKIFGKFIYSLGGTLMQIIIPGMFVIFYAVKKKKIAVQIFLIWLGENFINISVYASDARAKRLPLLGGNKVYHDWNWILNQIGLLEYDYIIGQIFFTLGVIALLFSLITPLLITQENQINNADSIDLNL
jgi:hypothetical protein